MSSLRLGAPILQAQVTTLTLRQPQPSRFAGALQKAVCVRSWHLALPDMCGNCIWAEHAEVH